jgi:hypothetical protein
MPMTRGSLLGYDNERMVFKFTMLNGDEMPKGFKTVLDKKGWPH